ncbi:MAG TPA: ribonuclease H [Kofleriaceae bacterium]|nr:ribonuclease H [Kofleriaceae bacterium]
MEIVYKPTAGAKVYRAGARNLSAVENQTPVEIEVGEPAPEKPAPDNKAPPAAKPGGGKRIGGKASVSVEGATAAANAEIAKAPDNAIHIWTDGACSGNPGPAGIGVVIIDGENRREISEYLGHGTNIIAELTAILRALQEVPDRSRPVVLYTDSQFSIDMLTKGWKAKKNVELVGEVRALCGQFPDLRFVWVRGHANVPLNVRTDELATEAVARGR